MYLLPQDANGKDAYTLLTDLLEPNKARGWRRTLTLSVVAADLGEGACRDTLPLS